MTEYKSGPRTLTVDDAIDILNDIIKTDPAAVTALVNYRVPCNEALANHQTVQVRGSNQTVSMLGLINGLFGVDEDQYGYIAVVIVQETGEATKFVRADKLRKKA